LVQFGGPAAIAGQFGCRGGAVSRGRVYPTRFRRSVAESRECAFRTRRYRAEQGLLEIGAGEGSGARGSISERSGGQRSRGKRVKAIAQSSQKDSRKAAKKPILRLVFLVRSKVSNLERKWRDFAEIGLRSGDVRQNLSL